MNSRSVVLQALEHVPLALLVIDRSGTVIAANRLACGMFGHPYGALVGGTLDAILPESAKSDHRGYLDRYFAAPEVRQMGVGRTLECRRSDGTSFPAEIGLAPVSLDRGLAAMACLTDLTDRQRRRRISDGLTRFLRATSTAGTADVLLHAALDGVGQTMAFDLAEFWTTRKEGDPMTREVGWHADPKLVDDGGPLMPGEGAVGQAWGTGEPAWLLHAQAVPDAPTSLATEVAVPVVAQGCLRGVLRYGAQRPVQADQDTLAALRTVATALGQAMDRFDADEASRQDRLRAQALASRSSELAAQLARFVSPHLSGSLQSGVLRAAVEARRRLLTVFFSDIADFTRASEILTADDLTRLLNDYFQSMSEIAASHGGHLDKFIGDAVMVLFGDLSSAGAEDDAERCVAMALAMQQAIARLRPAWEACGIARPLRVRMGIATGYCTVGNFGSGERLSYTAIGPPVNLASRLERAAVPGQILVSEATCGLLHKRRILLPIAATQLKGITGDVRIYEVCPGPGHADFSHESAGVQIRVCLDKLDSAARADVSAAVRRLQQALEGSPAETVTGSGIDF